MSGKWRVVEKSSGKVVKNRGGKAADGGGHASQAAATRQMQAINISQAKKSGHTIIKK